MATRGSPKFRLSYHIKVAKRDKAQCAVKKSHRARQRGDTGVGWQGKINIGRNINSRVDIREERVVVNKIISS